MAADGVSAGVNTRLPQRDFDSLAIPEQSEVPLYDPFPRKSPDLLQENMLESSMAFHSVPEADNLMTEACEQSEVKQRDLMEVSDSTTMMTPALSGAPSRDDYEPVRICSLAAPPKQFYRRFWRSVARRILESCKSTAVAFEEA